MGTIKERYFGIDLAQVEGDYLQVANSTLGKSGTANVIYSKHAIKRLPGKVIYGRKYNIYRISKGKNGQWYCLTVDTVTRKVAVISENYFNWNNVDIEPDTAFDRSERQQWAIRQRQAKGKAIREGMAKAGQG